MSNMSYCRFTNTNIDFDDCKEQLENYGLLEKDENGEHLGRSEFNAAIELIEKAREIAEMFEGEDFDDVRENYKQLKR